LLSNANLITRLGEQHLVQVWFPGVHSNIGGGIEDQGIADITLAWMMSQLKDMITFDNNYTELLYGLTKEWETKQFKKEREWSLGIPPPPKLKWEREDPC
jgi:hypothetical protein